MIFGRITRLPALSLLFVVLALLPAFVEGFQPLLSRSALTKPQRHNSVKVQMAGSSSAAAMPDKDKPRGGGHSSHGAGGWQKSVVPISVALIIGTFSVLEIVESMRETREFALGHAHGIFLLALIRLFRSLAILQTQVEEFEEGLEHAGVDLEFEEDRGSKGKSFVAAVARFAVSPTLTIAACVAAGVACMIEVVDDLKPGGHHGAAFLALSEIVYQLRRLFHLREKRRKAKGIVSTEANKGVLMRMWQWFCKKVPFGIIIALGAVGFAGYELMEDIRPGGHHGVAVLAAAELVENLNRSKTYRKARRKRLGKED